jgi:hypothetical protein
VTLVTMDEVPSRTAAALLGERHWRVAAIALLSVRLIQGFIYWGGGSRRFIYDPEKLDPDTATWMANKFQSAMPGALLGTDHLIAFLLHHFSKDWASKTRFPEHALCASARSYWPICGLLGGVPLMLGRGIGLGFGSL